MENVKVARESNTIKGHVLDVAARPLLAALRRYDPQLYIRWAPKKRGGRGVWELRRKPEFKTIKEAIPSDRYGIPDRPGDIHSLGSFSIVEPKYHETDVENHVKDFEVLGYHMVDWVAKHDGWNYGFRGKNLTSEADYNEAKYLEKIDAKSDEDRQYALKQYKSEIRWFKDYVLSGGDPALLMQYWGK